VAQEALVG